MKNDKPTGFIGLSLNFSSLSLKFSGFCFFFQNLNFLNRNQPFFDESKKPVRTGFIDLHKNPFHRYCNTCLGYDQSFLALDSLLQISLFRCFSVSHPGLY
jgi:hypothetical protein